MKIKCKDFLELVNCENKIDCAPCQKVSSENWVYTLYNVDGQYVLSGKLKPGAKFVTRSAPADPKGINPGGAIEVVVSSGDVQVSSFSAGAKTAYTGN